MEKSIPPDGMAADSTKSEGPQGLGMSGLPPGEAGTPGALRQRFVLGIFAGLPAAEKALENIMSGADRTCDVLMLSDAGQNGGTKQDGRTSWPAGRLSGRMRCPGCGAASCSHVRVHVDAFGSLAPAVSETLAQSPPFAPLAESLRDPDTGGKTTSAGTPRPFQNIVHHLAGGATAVIVRVASAEQQLRASRAFLEAGCEVLLTHELMLSATG